MHHTGHLSQGVARKLGGMNKACCGICRCLIDTSKASANHQAILITTFLICFWPTFPPIHRIQCAGTITMFTGIVPGTSLGTRLNFIPKFCLGSPCSASAGGSYCLNTLVDYTDSPHGDPRLKLMIQWSVTPHLVPEIMLGEHRQRSCALNMNESVS